jgi:hypothetical protein
MTESDAAEHVNGRLAIMLSARAATHVANTSNGTTQVSILNGWRMIEAKERGILRGIDLDIPNGHVAAMLGLPRAGI